MLDRRAKSDEYYTARRLRREARWSRPITSFKARLRAWSNLLLADHGVLRLFYLNQHQVTPLFWRSAQPAPHDLSRMAKDGLKTIINLRGGRSHGAWQLEQEAAAQHNITIVDCVIRSREAPERAAILALPAFFESLAYPALAHCKSGADRAGLFAALYLLIRENASVEQAMQELTLRKGHFRYAQTGILDAFLESYRDEGEGLGKPFLRWVAEDYDAERLKAQFKSQRLSSLIADTMLKRE